MGDRNTPQAQETEMVHQILKSMVPPRLRAPIRRTAEAPIASTLVPPWLLQYLWPYRPHAPDALTWDEEYSSGRWDCLSSIQEMPRNALIVGYCGWLDRRISVLDLGCGAGLLSRQLGPLRYSAYVGVDLSKVAIAQARTGAPENVEFLVADVENYAPGRKFDVIILNEVLYYLRRPEVLLQRCTSFLENNGVFIVSLWDGGQSGRAWRQCSSRIRVLDEVFIRHHDAAWWVRLCRPLERLENTAPFPTSHAN